MRKTFFLLVIVLFFDIAGSAFLGNKAADAELKKMGIPLAFYERRGDKPGGNEGLWYFLEGSQVFSSSVGYPWGRILEYEDTWLEERNYGGTRKHEGCDIFGSNEKPGYYPVLSITDGIVEKVGWLPWAVTGSE